MHIPAKYFITFIPKCYALAVAAVSAELKAILPNIICKISQFLCSFVNSAHDGQFCAKLCTHRIADFWHHCHNTWIHSNQYTTRGSGITGKPCNALYHMEILLH